MSDSWVILEYVTDRMELMEVTGLQQDDSDETDLIESIMINYDLNDEFDMQYEAVMNVPVKGQGQGADHLTALVKD